ncbi:unnamed protein product [Schistocephalus solidus]|uniref:WH2 domain-containing protein n=1 Tax=Schistocephalus solidus TaxID=70667 RepID=A0A183SVW6_SCHSO|nr:unnamed protein product [Schistocephalus solidus]
MEEDIIQQVPVSRTGVHPGRLLPHREAEEGICQDQVELCAARADVSQGRSGWQRRHQRLVMLSLAAAPEEGVAGSHILHLTLFREPGFAESSNLVKASTDTPDSPTEDVPSKISASTSSKIIPVSPTSASRKALTVSGPGSSGGSGSNLSTVHAFHEKTIRPPPPPPPINLPARSGANPGGG